jgi:hypothetical protein
MHQATKPRSHLCAGPGTRALMHMRRPTDRILAIRPQARRRSTSLSQVLRAYHAALKTPETPSVNLVACADCGQAHLR